MIDSTYCVCSIRHIYQCNPLWVCTPLHVPSYRLTTAFFSADALRRIYPKHSLVMTRDLQLNILRFPGVKVSPLEKTPMVSNLVFVPLARSLGGLPGILVDQIQFGAYQLSFNVSYQSSILRPLCLTNAIATSILGFRRRGKSRIGQLCFGKSVYWHTQFPLGFGTSTQTYILHQGNCLSDPLSTV